VGGGGEESVLVAGDVIRMEITCMRTRELYTKTGTVRKKTMARGGVPKWKVKLRPGNRKGLLGKRTKRRKGMVQGEPFQRRKKGARKKTGFPKIKTKGKTCLSPGLVMMGTGGKHRGGSPARGVFTAPVAGNPGGRPKNAAAKERTAAKTRAEGERHQPWLKPWLTGSIEAEPARPGRDRRENRKGEAGVQVPLHGQG